jgi:gluconolactonase
MVLLADGLSFPEGPIALSDGSFLLVEMHRGTLTRVSADGGVDVVADCGGGPNGTAVGPDGAVYVCNNGGRWPDQYEGGRIERVDLDTGQVEVVYEACDGHRLSSPNDLVFDPSGDFWFTDTGKFRDRERDFGRVYFASASGDHIVEVMDRLDTPNGIGLSPDEQTLYVAESLTGRLYRRAITGRGQLEKAPDHDPDRLVCGLPGVQMFDSLAVDGQGNVCVATLFSGRITVAPPDGSAATQYSFPPEFEDTMPTNVCFGGPDMRTAYMTLSASGRLVACPWPTPGLPLAYNR